MKIRKGFVSNSSTSSFICGVCGSIEAGMDFSLNDFDMKECVHGHTFHIDCNNIKEPELTNEFVYEKLKDKWTKQLTYREEYKKKYEGILQGIVEPLDYEKNFSKDYFEKQIRRFTEGIKKYMNKIESLTSSFYNETTDLFLEKYRCIYEDEFYGEPVQEEYCPVCQKLKKMEQDSKYKEYKKLYEYFEGYLPSGRKSV